MSSTRTGCGDEDRACQLTERSLDDFSEVSREFTIADHDRLRKHARVKCW